MDNQKATDYANAKKLADLEALAYSQPQYVTEYVWKDGKQVRKTFREYPPVVWGRYKDLQNPNGCECEKGADGLPIAVAKPTRPPELVVKCGTCGLWINCVDPYRHEI